MRNRELNRKVKEAISDATPDILDSIINDCEKKKGTVIIMPKQTTQKSGIRNILAMAAAFALILTGLGFSMFYYQNWAVASTVSLDVNPGIEITLNRQERVLQAKALNEDGAIILGNMDLKNTDMDVAVHAIIGSLLKNGYLNDEANSILISVDGKNAEKMAAIRNLLSEKVDEILLDNGVEGAVMSQVVADRNAEEIAKTYQISLGKAQLIDQFCKANPRYSIKELVGMTVNELNVLTQSAGLTLQNLNVTGAPSLKAYITPEEALKAALQGKSFTQADITELDIELEHEQGIIVYEIEFNAGSVEYEILVNATTADVIRTETDENEPAISEGQKISWEEAQQRALAHVGLTASDVQNLTWELDREHGIVCYEIEFETSEKEYDITVDAASGEILEACAERNDDAVPQGQYIGQDRATELALAYAGVAAADAEDLSCELDEEDGKMAYDVEFEVGETEYAITVDAVDGSILNAQTEQDNASAMQEQYIGSEKAKALALSHAGVSVSDAENLSCELDEDDKIYSIEFEADKMEYELEVDAVNGEILKSETEAED